MRVKNKESGVILEVNEVVGDKYRVINPMNNKEVLVSNKLYLPYDKAEEKSNNEKEVKRSNNRRRINVLFDEDIKFPVCGYKISITLRYALRLMFGTSLAIEEGKTIYVYETIEGANQLLVSLRGVPKINKKGEEVELYNTLFSKLYDLFVECSKLPVDGSFKYLKSVWVATLND